MCYYMALTATLLGGQYSHFMTEKQTQRGQVICPGPHSSCLLGTRQLPGKSSVCQCCRWGRLRGIVFPTLSLHLSPRPFLCPCAGAVGRLLTCCGAWQLLCCRSGQHLHQVLQGQGELDG